MGQVTAAEAVTMLLFAATTVLLLTQVGHLSRRFTGGDLPDAGTRRRTLTRTMRYVGIWQVSVGLFLLTQEPVSATAPLLVGAVLAAAAPVWNLGHR